MASIIDRSTPTTTAIAVSTAILGVLVGYFIGQGSTLLGVRRRSSQATTAHDTSSSDDEADVDELAVAGEGGLKDFASNGYEECKLVLVVRTDLGMTKGRIIGILAKAQSTYCSKIPVLPISHDTYTFLVSIGKIAAQCGHATLACYKALESSNQRSLLDRWERGGQAKVALQVRSEDELELLQAQAMSLGVCARIIHDAGRTQIASGSATVLGVGPAPKSIVDQVTGELKLL